MFGARGIDPRSIDPMMISKTALNGAFEALKPPDKDLVIGVLEGAPDESPDVELLWNLMAKACMDQTGMNP